MNTLAFISRGAVACVAFAMASVTQAARPAAEITRLKLQVESDLAERGVKLDQEAGQFTDPSPPSPPPRPVPGEMTGSGRPSLLGVEYGDPGITNADVDARRAYSTQVEKIQASIAPKLKEQDELKKRIYQEKEKAWHEAEQLNKDRNKAIDEVRKRYANTRGKSEEENAELKAIENRYIPRIQGLKKQEQELWRQYYAVDEEKRRIIDGVKPQMEQADAAFQQQTKARK